MNNIRKIITERLENARVKYNTYWDDLDLPLSLTDNLLGQIKAYQDCLNLIPAPRTKVDILNDFAKLGYKIAKLSTMYILEHDKRAIYIHLDTKQYHITALKMYEGITMQEHKLLNELFEVIFDE